MCLPFVARPDEKNEKWDGVSGRDGGLTSTSEWDRREGEAMASKHALGRVVLGASTARCSLAVVTGGSWGAAAGMVRAAAATARAGGVASIASAVSAVGSAAGSCGRVTRSFAAAGLEARVGGFGRGVASSASRASSSNSTEGVGEEKASAAEGVKEGRAEGGKEGSGEEAGADEEGGWGEAGEDDSEKNPFVRALTAIFTMGTAIPFAGGVALYFAGEEEDVEVATRGWPEFLRGPTLYLKHELEVAVAEYADPQSDRLLPQEPWEVEKGIVAPRTLVLDLEETLVHAVWERKKGWTILQRPGLQQFLDFASHYYEIVVFSSMNAGFTDPVMERVDPQRTRIAYRLGRADCKFTKKGVYVRDLSKLGRDLHNIVYVTASPETFELQPDNGIAVSKFKLEEGGDEEEELRAVYDTELLDLIPFLESLATANRANIPDVRAVIKTYRGKNVGEEFRRRSQANRARKGRAAGQK